MFKAKLFMKVIRFTKTGISVRKETRRLPIHGVSLFFPRLSSSLRRHYFLIFDPDVISLTFYGGNRVEKMAKVQEGYV